MPDIQCVTMKKQQTQARETKERGEKEKRREKKGTINDARKRNYPLNFKLETYVLNSTEGKSAHGEQHQHSQISCLRPQTRQL